MNLPARLISWAQNEEMIDSYFLGHGRDCLEAAEKLRDGDGDYWFPLILVIMMLVVMGLAGSVKIYGLRSQITTLRAENTRLLTRTCPQAGMETPMIIQRDWRVTG